MKHDIFTGGLKKFVARYRSVRAAAAALGVNPCTIYRWQNKGMPATVPLQVEEVTGGAVKASDFE